MNDFKDETQPEQASIPSRKATRVAALAGAGAEVGVNYLKHYGRKAVGRESKKDDLHEANAEAVYRTLSRLKGGPLKLAQMLSIDQNMLPEAYRKQFAQAQYSAPPLSYPLVVKTFRREFDKEPLEVFEEFTQSAVHGASIGQVHRARIGDKHYAIKVQYPGVADSLSSDLAVVKPVALQILGMKDADVEPYFREVKARLLEETDYQLELQHSVALSEQCRQIDGIRFPDYYPEFSKKRVLTMDWVDGQLLDQFAKTETDQTKKNAVGQALWNFYHFQIHHLKQFHADPHPGNFLVDAENEVVVLDFGCTKKIAEDFHGDYFRLLDPEIVNDPVEFEAALVRLEILLESDSPRQRQLILENAEEGTRLLGRPFHEDHFDFGDQTYMASVYAMGEQHRNDSELRSINPARGSADSIYLNRAYFGLYSLMGLLGAKIETRRDV